MHAELIEFLLDAYGKTGRRLVTKRMNLHPRWNPNGKSWKTHGEDTPVVAQNILDHWSGKQIGSSWPSLDGTRIIVIDVDAKNEADRATLLDRARPWITWLRENLSVEPLVCSSPGNGLHVTVLIDSETPAPRLGRFIVHAAAAHGLPVHAVDLFPFEKGKGIRFPFGGGQRILRADLRTPRYRDTETDKDLAMMHYDDATASLSLIEQIAADAGWNIDVPIVKEKQTIRARPTSSARMENWKNTVSGIGNGVNGVSWSAHCATMLSSGAVESGSVGGWNSARQMATYLLGTRSMSASDAAVAMKGWAGAASLDDGSAEFLFDLCQKQIERVQRLIARGDIIPGREDAGSAFVGGTAADPVSARRACQALLEEDIVIETIIERALVGMHRPRAIARVAAGMKSALEAARNNGIWTNIMVGDEKRISHGEGAKTRVYQIVREKFVASELCLRIRGKLWSKETGVTAPALYGIRFSRIAAIREELGLPEIHIDDVRGAARAPRAVWNEKKIEKVGRIDSGILFSKLMCPRVIEETRVFSGRISHEETVAMKRMKMSGMITTGDHMLFPGIPVIPCRSEREVAAGRVLADFPAIRAMRRALALPYISVELDPDLVVTDDEITLDTRTEWAVPVIVSRTVDDDMWDAAYDAAAA